MQAIVLFMVAIASILAAPGPTNALLAMSGASARMSRAWPLVAAVVAAYLISTGVLVAASAPLIASFPPVTLGLRAILIVYLLWLAWCLWRLDQAETEVAAPVTWRHLFVTTLLNPKGPIIAFGVFPPLAGVTDVLVHFGGFAAIIIVVAFGWMTFGASLARLVERRDRPPLMPRITAIVLIFFAGVVAVSAASAPF